MQLPGTPSDEIDDVLATGHGDITTLFVSMATRHPDGTDAEYLRWHTLDHRLEQHRLSSRARLTATGVHTGMPRRTRGESRPPRRDRPCDDVLLHRSRVAWTDFSTLAKALIGAKRKLPLLPPVERGVYDVQSKSAAPRVKVGADVLPWWPVKGVYMLLERGDATAADALLDVDGVAGIWSAATLDVDARLASATGRPIHHVLLPRRRPGRDGGAA